jgi:drug/metabolite transporter (DMT)-like permease
MEQQKGGSWRMVAAMGLSGTIGVFVLLSGQSPLTVVVVRCLLGSAALFGWLAWTGGAKKMHARALGWTVLGAAALIANWLCLFSAFRSSSISVVTVVYHVQPFFLIVLAALAQRELPAAHKLPWLLLAFTGVALTAGLDMHSLGGASARGVGLALAAAFLYALATLATRKLAGYAPAQIAGVQLLIGLVVLGPMARFDAGAMGVQAWGSLLVIGLVHTGLVYNLMYAAFQRLRADTLATLSFIYPLVAIAADLLVFGTVLTGWQWLGMGLILASLLANQRVQAVPAPRLACREG